MINSVTFANTVSWGNKLVSVFANLTWTGYQMFKHYNHLITNIIVTRSLNQPHPTWQIPSLTGLPPGYLHARNRDNQPDGCVGNAYSLNCRAVSCKTLCAYIIP